MEFDDVFDEGPFTGRTVEQVLGKAAGRRWIQEQLEEGDLVFSDEVYETLEAMGMC